jgi:predicted aspartyl protease
VRLKPFLDQTNTETARKADKKSLYKDHIEKVIRLDTTLAGRFFGDDDDMVIVEPVVCEGGLLSVTIHLIIYPFSEASVANVHVYNENGQHLGLPVAKGMAVNVEGKWVDSQQFDRSPRIGELATGQEYLISQSFTADKLPAKGKLKLIITGKNVSVNCAAEYRIANNKQKTGDFASLASLPQSVTTSTKTIRCRRAGNHLWVPVEIGSGALTQQTELLLDTGASVTCIPPEIYEKLGRGNSAHEKIELETANGVISADTDVLPIKTSAFKRDIRVAFDSSNKLLGANYFTDCIFTVDVNNECIYVNRNGVQSDEYQPLMNEKKHYIGE